MWPFCWPAGILTVWCILKANHLMSCVAPHARANSCPTWPRPRTMTAARLQRRPYRRRSSWSSERWMARAGYRPSWKRMRKVTDQEFSRVTEFRSLRTSGLNQNQTKERPMPYLREGSLPVVGHFDLEVYGSGRHGRHTASRFSIRCDAIGLHDNEVLLLSVVGAETSVRALVAGLRSSGRDQKRIDYSAHVGDINCANLARCEDGYRIV